MGVGHLRLVGQEYAGRGRRRRLFPRPGIEAAVGTLMMAVNQRDELTGHHSERVAHLAARVGARLDMSRAELDDLELAARLHDVGKIGIPDAVLLKPGPLSDLEWRVMRSHSVRGAEIVSRIPEIEHVTEAVRHVHERWDGAGYPDGLAEEDIPLASRVLAVCDAFDSMTADRPYRRSIDAAVAGRELRAGAGVQFDPAVVHAFTEVGASLAPARR